MQKKFLVIQTAFLGDAILTLPMIEKLKEQNQDACIDVIAIPGTKEIFENSPFVNEILIFEKRGKHKTLSGMISFASVIRKKRYSRIYSPHRSFRSSLLVLFSGVTQTFGFDTASLSFVYKNIIKYRKDYHEVKRNLEVIGYKTDNENWKIIPLIKCNPIAEAKAESMLKDIKGKIIAIAPGSVWTTKRYPVEYYTELAGMITSAGIFVILLGGKEDAELCRVIESSVPGKIFSFAGKLTLTESVFVIKKCEMVISNDSAPTHLSLIAGKPAITIFCSTVPAFGFYPYHLKSISLSYDDLSCKPCGIHGLRKCPVGTFDCALKLSPQLVSDRIKDFMS
jgi:heptosyltransferase II